MGNAAARTTQTGIVRCETASSKSYGTKIREEVPFLGIDDYMWELKSANGNSGP